MVAFFIIAYLYAGLVLCLSKKDEYNRNMSEWGLLIAFTLTFFLWPFYPVVFLMER